MYSAQEKAIILESWHWLFSKQICQHNKSKEFVKHVGNSFCVGAKRKDFTNYFSDSTNNKSKDTNEEGFLIFMVVADEWCLLVICNMFTNHLQGIILESFHLALACSAAARAVSVLKYNNVGLYPTLTNLATVMVL